MLGIMVVHIDTEYTSAYSYLWMPQSNQKCLFISQPEPNLK